MVGIKVVLYDSDLGFDVERKFWGKSVIEAQKRLAEYLQKTPNQRFVRQVNI